jgi:hypothetical protein
VYVGNGAEYVGDDEVVGDGTALDDGFELACVRDRMRNVDMVSLL